MDSRNYGKPLFGNYWQTKAPIIFLEVLLYVVLVGTIAWAGNLLATIFCTGSELG